jgi:hypothetical protein
MNGLKCIQGKENQDDKSTRAETRSPGTNPHSTLGVYDDEL